MGMCIPNFYKPLVYSRKSHVGADAKARYLETAALVYSWYTGDCWEDESSASKMIRRVNNMHRSSLIQKPETKIIIYYRFIANKVRPINAELDSQVKNVFESADIDCEAELTEQDRILLEDIANVKSKRIIPQEYYDYVNDSDAFSQVD